MDQLRASQLDACDDASTPLQRRAGLLPSGSAAADATTSVQQTIIPRPAHLSVPKSRPIVLIELFAGLGILSVVASQFGLEPSAFLERDALLLRLLEERHPEAQLASEFSQRKWEQWTFPSDAFIVVFGGPPCTTISTAGKQLGPDDPQSACINSFLEIASFFGA